MIEIAPTDLATKLRDARSRTLAYVADLSDAQLTLPLCDTLNPVLWEVGHIGYFAEFWTLRALYGREAMLRGADALYDSAKIPHGDRWDLPLPDRSGTMRFLDAQLRAVLEHLSPRDLPAANAYFHQLILHHEDMHGEAILYMRDAMAYDQPALAYNAAKPGDPDADDAIIPAGVYRIGARPDDAFVFDNEKWEHEVHLPAYAIARQPVTNAQFARFVDAGGYDDPQFWSDEGWAWRTQATADHPLHWRRGSDGWERRHFSSWRPLNAREPVVHVNHYEAQAFCVFSGRRLPSEAEWEIAATGGDRRRYPWGDETPTPEHANLDAWYGDVTECGALGAGASPFGVTDMLGGVWEWTSTIFGPYPGFAPDPYREYSEPWFGNHFVLRGGAWSTRAHMITARWRNFYRPQRRDVFSGFRTCSPRKGPSLA